jgi:hypothetical protein
MNVLLTEHGYHNVGIGMFVFVRKEEYVWKTPEPEKNTEWVWMHWDEFMKQQPKFIPFKYFFE